MELSQPSPLCEACFEQSDISHGDLGFELVQCSKCNIKIHYRCAGLYEAISSKTLLQNYICQKCLSNNDKIECNICKCKEGFIIESTENTYIHPICGLFHPYYSLIDPFKIRYEELKDINRNSQNHKILPCHYCHKKIGYLNQCKECKKTAHTFCAFQSRKNQNENEVQKTWGFQIAISEHSNMELIPEEINLYMKYVFSNPTYDPKIQLRGGTTEIFCPDHCPLANDCICNDTSNNSMMICCDNCNIWYHSNCLGIQIQDKSPDIFICPECKNWHEFKMKYLFNIFEIKNQQIYYKNNKRRKINDILLYRQVWESKANQIIDSSRVKECSEIYSIICEFTKGPWTFGNKVHTLIQSLEKCMKFDKEKVKAISEYQARIGGDFQKMKDEIETCKNNVSKIMALKEKCDQEMKIKTKGIEICLSKIEAINLYILINTELFNKIKPQDISIYLSKLQELKQPLNSYIFLTKLNDEYLQFRVRFDKLFEKSEITDISDLNQIIFVSSNKPSYEEGKAMVKKGESFLFDISDILNKIDAELSKCEKWDYLKLCSMTEASLKIKDLSLLRFKPLRFENFLKIYRSIFEWEEKINEMNIGAIQTEEIEKQISMYKESDLIFSEKYIEMKEEINKRKLLEEKIKSLLNSSDLKEIKSFLDKCKIQDHEGIKKLTKRRNLLKKLRKIEKNKIEFKLTFSELDELINDSLKQCIAHDKLDSAKIIHQQFILLDNSINRFIVTNENAYNEDDEPYVNLQEKINNSIVCVTQKREFDNLLKSREWYFNTLKIFKIYEKSQHTLASFPKSHLISSESLFKLADYFELINKTPLSLMKLQLDAISVQEMMGLAKKLRHDLEISYHCLLLEEELKKNLNGKINLNNINLINLISSYNLPINCMFYDFIEKIKLILQEFNIINTKYIELLNNSLKEEISEPEVSKLSSETSSLIESMQRSSFDFETEMFNLQNNLSIIYYCQELKNTLKFQEEINDDYLDNFYKKGLDLKFPQNDKNFIKFKSMYEEYRQFKDKFCNYLKKHPEYYMEKSEVEKMLEFFKSIRIIPIIEQLEKDLIIYKNWEEKTVQLLKKLNGQELFSNEDFSQIKEQSKIMHELIISNSEIRNNLILMEWIVEASLIIINNNFENTSFECLTKLSNIFNNLIIKDFDTIKANKLQSQIIGKLTPSSLISEECKKEHLNLTELLDLDRRIKSLSIVNPFDAEYVRGLIKHAENISSNFEEMKNKKSTIEEYEKYATQLCSFPVVMSKEETELESIIFKAKIIQEYASCLIKETEFFSKRIPIIKIRSLLDDKVNNYCSINEIMMLNEKIDKSRTLLQQGKELLEVEYQKTNDFNQLSQLRQIHSLIEKIPIDFLEEEINLKKQLWRKFLESYNSVKPTLEELNFLINITPRICLNQDLIKKNKLNKLKIESDNYISMISEIKNENMLNFFTEKIKDFEINLSAEIERKRTDLISNSKNIKQIEIFQETEENHKNKTNEIFSNNSIPEEKNSSQEFIIENKKFKANPLTEVIEKSEKDKSSPKIFEPMNDKPSKSDTIEKNLKEIIINAPVTDIKAKVNGILRMNKYPLSPEKIDELSNIVENYLKSVSLYDKKFYNEEAHKILAIFTKINDLPLVSHKLNKDSNIATKIASKLGSDDLILRLIQFETKLKEKQKKLKLKKDNDNKNQKEILGKKREIKALKKNPIQEIDDSIKKLNPLLNVKQNSSSILKKQQHLPRDKDNDDSDSVYSLIAESEKLSGSEDNNSAQIQGATIHKKQFKNTPKKDIPYDPFSIEQLNKAEVIQPIKPLQKQISRSNLQKIVYDPLNPNNNEEENHTANVGDLLELWDGIIEVSKDKLKSVMYSQNLITNFQLMPSLVNVISVEGRLKYNDFLDYITKVRFDNSYILLSGWICVDHNDLVKADTYINETEAGLKISVIELKEISTKIYVFPWRVKNYFEIMKLLNINPVPSLIDKGQLQFGFVIPFRRRTIPSIYKKWNPKVVETKKTDVRLKLDLFQREEEYIDMKNKVSKCSDEELTHFKGIATAENNQQLLFVINDVINERGQQSLLYRTDTDKSKIDPGMLRNEEMNEYNQKVTIVEQFLQQAKNLYIDKVLLYQKMIQENETN